MFLDFCFGPMDFISISDFTKIIEEKSSEMLLSVFLFADFIDHDSLAGQVALFRELLPLPQQLRQTSLGRQQ